MRMLYILTTLFQVEGDVHHTLGYIDSIFIDKIIECHMNVLP